jgi:hypothetical protein
MAKLPNAAIGSIVECRFLDHCEDGPAIECTVWGRLKERTRATITILAWESDGQPVNEKTWTIVRKAIASIKQLQ